jgi:hypothetical protein
MSNISAYPYPTYIPNKIAASCLAGIVGISLIAWFVQSCQIRFRPLRLNTLLLISHLAIFVELIIRAAVAADLQNSKNIFIAVNSLFAVGQRVIIISNVAFIMEIHREKSCLTRSVPIIAMVCVITSGLLLAPVNTYSFDPNEINQSYLFREISTSVLLAVTILFYPVWFWSKTVKDMTRQAIVLISISSVMCMMIAIFNVIESLSQYYNNINGNEGWLYGFQIAPIILVHITWSILHLKRTLIPSHARMLKSRDSILITQEELSENTPRQYF